LSSRILLQFDGTWCSFWSLSCNFLLPRRCNVSRFFIVVPCRFLLSGRSNFCSAMCRRYLSTVNRVDRLSHLPCWLLLCGFGQHELCSLPFGLLLPCGYFNDDTAPLPSGYIQQCDLPSKFDRMLFLLSRYVLWQHGTHRAFTSLHARLLLPWWFVITYSFNTQCE
jgi:hypothetical protein